MPKSKSKSKSKRALTCRRCGCDNDHACLDPVRPRIACHWVERNLCSACLSPQERRRYEKGYDHPSRETSPVEEALLIINSWKSLAGQRDYNYVKRLLKKVAPHDAQRHIAALHS